MTLECDGALSDLILKAALGAIPAYLDNMIDPPDCGERNQPLVPLLVGLIDSVKATASAVADNAWDSGRPLPADLAADLIAELGRCSALIQQSTESAS
jgi:hypothetical protein